MVHCTLSAVVNAFLWCISSLPKELQRWLNFSEHLKNKSNVLNNGNISPVSQQENTGHAILITRLIMLDTVASRSYTDDGNNQYTWASVSGAMQNIQCRAFSLKGGQLDLAWFSSSRGIIVKISISEEQTSPLTHTLHIHHTKETSSGYYSESSEIDSIFPCLITWSNTRVTKSSVEKQK